MVGTTAQRAPRALPPGLALARAGGAAVAVAMAAVGAAGHLASRAAPPEKARALPARAQPVVRAGGAAQTARAGGGGGAVLAAPPVAARAHAADARALPRAVPRADTDLAPRAAPARKALARDALAPAVEAAGQRAHARRVRTGARGLERGEGAGAGGGDGAVLARPRRVTLAASTEAGTVA